jgi:hypothetical protein
MAVQSDCRHYSSRTTNGGVVERCRMDMAQAVPFDCPDNCIFFEPRGVTGTGWTVQEDDQPDLRKNIDERRDNP